MASAPAPRFPRHGFIPTRNSDPARSLGSTASRRRLLGLAAGWISVTLAALGPNRVTAQTPSTPAANAASPQFMHRGINYDVGINWVPGFSSRPVWNLDHVKHDIVTMSDELHCTAINLFGDDIERLLAAASVATERGLVAWLQPRLIDGTQAECVEQLATLATGAEELRAGGADVVLNVGCELSIFTSSMVDGTTYLDRIATLSSQQVDPASVSEALSSFLGDLITAARSRFGGELTYASGSWEAVDWDGFDIVAMNLYRDSTNADHYQSAVESLRSRGKPAVITEFGCCTYEGAAARGGSGFDIIDWTTTPPTIADGYVRSEQAQADELLALIDIYEAAGLAGAFVFAFIEPTNPYSPDPRFDLDMASFGIVKAFPPGSG